MDQCRWAWGNEFSTTFRQRRVLKTMRKCLYYSSLGGIVSAPVNPSNTQVQFTPKSAGWSLFLSISPAAPGAGLTFAREAEVAPRTALIGIFASVVIMGCFPGTELPCLKNALAAKQACLSLGSVAALDAPARAMQTWRTLMHCVVQKAPPSFPSQGKRGVFPLPSNQFAAGEIGAACKILRVDYFPAAYNNVTVTFSATVLRTQPRALKTMARLPFISMVAGILLHFSTKAHLSFYPGNNMYCCSIVAKTGSKSSWVRMWLPTIASG